MNGKSKAAWAGALFLLIGACQINEVECDQECIDFWMDGPNHADICLQDSTCLVSRRLANPDSLDLAKPVILAVHGFTASTYEWQEFRSFAENPALAGGDIKVSLVRLGGHGLDIEDFRASGWKDWGRPILAEYDSLTAKGYRNISIACASTGCTLLMEYLHQGHLAAMPPKWIFMVDPIVIPTAKLLSLANVVGPILGNSPNPGSDTENAHWYVNRPQEDLKQLYELINRVKNELEDGFRLPKGTLAKVYKSKKDNSADPAGILYVYKGLRRSDRSHIEAELVDSRLHVVTRLAGRKPEPTAADTALQARIFREMAGKVLGGP